MVIPDGKWKKNPLYLKGLNTLYNTIINREITRTNFSQLFHDICRSEQN